MDIFSLSSLPHAVTFLLLVFSTFSALSPKARVVVILLGLISFAYALWADQQKRQHQSAVRQVLVGRFRAALDPVLHGFVGGRGYHLVVTHDGPDEGHMGYERIYAFENPRDYQVQSTGGIHDGRLELLRALQLPSAIEQLSSTAPGRESLRAMFAPSLRAIAAQQLEAVLLQGDAVLTEGQQLAGLRVLGSSLMREQADWMLYSYGEKTSEWAKVEVTMLDSDMDVESVLRCFVTDLEIILKAELDDPKTLSFDDGYDPYPTRSHESTSPDSQGNR